MRAGIDVDPGENKEERENSRDKARMRLVARRIERKKVRGRDGGWQENCGEFARVAPSRRLRRFIILRLADPDEINVRLMWFSEVRVWVIRDVGKIDAFVFGAITAYFSASGSHDRGCLYFWAISCTEWLIEALFVERGKFSESDVWDKNWLWYVL